MTRQLPLPTLMIVLAAALPAALMTACEGGDAPETPDRAPARPTAAPLDRPASRAGLRLAERLDDATITLADGNLPAGVDTSSYTLSGWTRSTDADLGDAPVWRAPLPVRLPLKRYFAAPVAASLFHEDSPLPFCNLPGPWQEGCWDIFDGEVLLASSADPSGWTAPIVLEGDGLAAIEGRMDPSASGLTPREFVVGELTLESDTRPGLWLPAPSTVSWELTLPEGATLELHAGLVDRAALSGGRSDGARLEVTVDGVAVSVTPLVPGEPFTPVTVDLAARAGQTVTLALATSPGPDPDGDYHSHYDYVLAAAPILWGEPERRARRVVLVGIDTLRADALTQAGYSRDTTAPLDDFAAEAFRFEQTWTPAPRTRPSFQSALSGRWPLASVGATTLGEHLRGAGFATAGFSANVQLHPRFGFHAGYDLWRYRNRRDARDQLGDALGWLKDQDGRDALAFVHLMDPHIFYEAPAPFTDRYVKDSAPGPLTGHEHRWAVLSQEQSAGLPASAKAWLRDRYDGEVRYTAGALADFLLALEALPGDTLVVLFTDHGEEFWDHGSYEHNHSLYDELVRGVLWIRRPGGAGGAVRTPVDTVDIVPTVLDLLGVAADPLDGTSLAPLLGAGGDAAALAATLEARPLPLGHLMYDRERWGVVYQGHKYLLETASGDQELYDLVADPGEQRNQAAAADSAALAQWRAALEAATGWPVGQGWRIHLGDMKAPFTATFSEPVRAAAVLDPEASERHRANIAWGEQPGTLPEEVGAVALSEDRLTLSFTPGVDPTGILGVVFESEVNRAVFEADGKRKDVAHEGGGVVLGGAALRVEPGAVILPDTTSGGVAPADDDDLNELRELGYIE